MRILSKPQLDVLKKMAEYKAVLEDIVVESGTRYGRLQRPYEATELIRYANLEALMKAGCIRHELDGRFTLLPIDRSQGVVKPCVLRWDTSDYYSTDTEYLATVGEEDGHMEDLDEDGELTEEEQDWRDDMLNRKDQYEEEMQEMGWEDAMTDLDDLMVVFKSQYLIAQVNNFGWLNQSGYKTFKAENGLELLREILPNTPCTWEVYHYTEPLTGKKGLALQNWHHDAPTGGEWYYIVECDDEDWEA